jgi:uncharacterized protein YukE
MEILWKNHDMPIEKATTTLDELMDALGVKGARAIGLSTKELREQLQEWGTEIATRVPAEPKPVKLTPKQKQRKEKMQQHLDERQKRTDERDEKEVHEEPIYPEEKDKEEWKKRGRPENPAETVEWEKKLRSNREGEINPQSGPVTEPQKLPEWVYLDEEEDTMGKSYQEILKATSQRTKFIESIKDLPPQERKEKMAEFHNRYKHKGTTPSIAGKPKIFWTAKNLQKPRRSERAGRMLGHKIPKQTLKNSSFMVSALTQLKTGNESKDKKIDTLIQILHNQNKETRTTSKDKHYDQYTITGKPGTKERRNYNEQEIVLDKLLELLDKGYKYDTRLDLQREVQEHKILSSRFLSSLSQDLFGDTKNIHPRLIDKLKKPRIYRAFMKFLHSQNKNMPRESSFRSALQRLDKRKGSHSKIIDLLIKRPKEYIYRENLYDEHLNIVNTFVTKHIKELSSSLKPLVSEGKIGEWDNTLDEIKIDYNKLSAEKQKKISLENFEGGKIVNIIKEILDDVKDLKEAQKAKGALIEIGENNGKSGTVNNDKYDIIMENFGLLKESYHWNKHIDEAQRKSDVEKPSSTGKEYTPNEKQLYKVYKDYKKQVYEQRQEVKRLKKEILEQNTDMQRQWNKAQKERDPKFVSEVDRLKSKLRKSTAVLDRLTNSLDRIKEKYPDLLGEKTE